VPTQAWLNGDFTGGPTIYDPASQVIAADGSVQRQSFACEYANCATATGNKIPTNLLSSVAQNIQKYYPAPNVSNPTVQNGITTNNVFYNVATNSPGGAISIEPTMTSRRAIA